MKLKEVDPETPGAHHLTRENLSYEIAFLESIEDGSVEMRYLDMRTNAGIIALQIRYLLSHFDQ